VRASGVQMETAGASAWAYAAPMTKEPALTKAALAALTRVDGTPEGSRMPAAITTRLTQLKLVERREWPNGPLWRSSAGDKHVRVKK